MLQLTLTLTEPSPVLEGARQADNTVWNTRSEVCFVGQALAVMVAIVGPRGLIKLETYGLLGRAAAVRDASGKALHAALVAERARLLAGKFRV